MGSKRGRQAVVVGVLLMVGGLVGGSVVPASADPGAMPDDTHDASVLDIASTSHHHGDGDEVVHRVVFEHRFAKRVLVRRFELYLEGRRGTTSPFESPQTLVYGRTRHDGDRIFMRLYYYDVEMVTHRLADVPIHKRPRAVLVPIPTSVISTTAPFTYRWVARIEDHQGGGQVVEDQTPWLWHRIAA